MQYTHTAIEIMLAVYQPVIGKDYTKYKNHVYRVFLNCLMMDNEKSNEEKYAIAAVFHDIGIWTNHTIDYLAPSIEQAKQYLEEIHKREWVEEITLMIHAHHKTGRYNGVYAPTVETFRKADYIDVTLGLFTYGLDKKVIAGNRKRFPNAGFHAFLIQKITGNFFRHPLKPLPMFTR